MIVQYFKQAWHQARTNVTYTLLYVTGVTLTMLFVMVMAIVLYVRIAPVYPETNRPNTMYITSLMLKRDQMSMSGNIGQWAYKELFSKLENVENMTLVTNQDRAFCKSTDGTDDFELKVKFVRDGFFKIYDFDFLAGRKFTEEENSTETGKVSIITDRLADRLFGGPGHAIGQTITVDRYDTTIVGVVRSASYLTSDSYADMYRPMGEQYYSGKPGIRDATGGSRVVLTTRDASQAEALGKEFATMLDKANNSDLVDDGDTRWEIRVDSQPMAHWRRALNPDVHSSDGSRIVWLYVVIILVLMIVPAINLSGLIGGRMDTRLSELGIRKSFGATRSSIMRQVIFENLLLTFIGAVAGMAGAWILVSSCRRWIFSIFDPNPAAIPDWVDVSLNGDMMFAPALFAVMLVICLAVNLLSAIVPAWIYMRKPIVGALYEKR